MSFRAKTITTSVAIILAVLTVPLLAYCQEDSAEERYNQKIEKVQQKLAGAVAAIEESNGGLPEIQRYLYYAMFYVYYGKLKANYNLDGMTLATNDISTLVDHGFLPDWPLNPLNNWEPMRVLTPGDPASPGDLCFSLCPPGYYSMVRGDAIEPVSFELFVYGPEATPEKFCVVVQHDLNKEWSIPPDGALYGLSFYMESNEERLKREARIEKLKAEGKID